ncbi:MAG: transposase [Phaeodactylibacter sp.]|nr:transposase [Phaeodactylibacter sp.]
MPPACPPGEPWRPGRQVTNHRILDIGQDTVCFAYKDYADGARKKEMALAGTEFLRRFCLHILPPHFRKVRHYGFLANACKNKRLAQALAALANKKLQLSSRSQRRALAKQRLFGKAADKCPCCHKGQMVTIETLEANKSPPVHLCPLFYN